MGRSDSFETIFYLGTADIQSAIVSLSTGTSGYKVQDSPVNVCLAL